MTITEKIKKCLEYVLRKKYWRNIVGGKYWKRIIESSPRWEQRTVDVGSRSIKISRKLWFEDRSFVFSLLLQWYVIYVSYITEILSNYGRRAKFAKSSVRRKRCSTVSCSNARHFWTNCGWRKVRKVMWFRKN